MRHLSTDELLLYAEGELEDRELCRHVADCVDCKAQMVDFQEAYVVAASTLLAQTRQPASRPAHLNHFRVRLAAEAELLAAHLSTEDLLLAVEDNLDADCMAHLSACAGCQDRAADIHVQLAEIEYELHRQIAFELPAERRAAALAALRVRLRHEVKIQKAGTERPWKWLPRFSLPRVPVFASYATGLAAACLVAWVGWNGVTGPDLPERDQVAEALLPATVASESITSAETVIRVQEPLIPQSPVRFELAETHGQAPAPRVELALVAAPTLEAAADWRPSASVAIDLPQPADLAAPPALAASAFPVPLPKRIVPPLPDSLDSAIEGSWILASTGLWKESLQAGGPEGRLHFTGSVSSDSERRRIESALREAAGEAPVDFLISVRESRAAATGSEHAAIATDRPVGGLVRNSLLKHYEDSARRSFQPLEASVLANELNHYVTSVMRDDAELLYHVHALHSVLNRAGIDEMRPSRRLRQVLRFHLDGVARHEKGVYDKLSEALAWTSWNYRSRTQSPDEFDSLGETSRKLLKDTLALDHALTAMFFGSSEPLDAQAGTHSIGTLLSRVRRHTRRLKKEVNTR